MTFEEKRKLEVNDYAHRNKYANSSFNNPTAYNEGILWGYAEAKKEMAEEIKRLRDALEYYSVEAIYCTDSQGREADHVHYSVPMIEDDMGERAREALQTTAGE